MDDSPQFIAIQFTWKKIWKASH